MTPFVFCMEQEVRILTITNKKHVFMDGMNCLLTFEKDDHGGIPIFGYFIIDQIFSVCRYEMRYESTSFLESVRIVRIDDLLIKSLSGIFVIAVSVRISYIMVSQINDTVFLSGI